MTHHREALRIVRDAAETLFIAEHQAGDTIAAGHRYIETLLRLDKLNPVTGRQPHDPVEIVL